MINIDVSFLTKEREKKDEKMIRLEPRLVAADLDVKQQIIKLFVRLHHVSYLSFMHNEMS